MSDKNVRVEVGSNLLWEYSRSYSSTIIAPRVVTVTKVYKDYSFRVEDSDGKDRGRFKDTISKWSRDTGYEKDPRPEVRWWGNDGWGNTLGRVKPLPEGITDETLRAEIEKAKAEKQAEQNAEQAEREKRNAEIIAAQGDGLDNVKLVAREGVSLVRIVNKQGAELVVFFSTAVEDAYDYKTDESYNEYSLEAHAYGENWTNYKSWSNTRGRGRSIRQALEQIAISLW